MSKTIQLIYDMEEHYRVKTNTNQEFLSVLQFHQEFESQEKSLLPFEQFFINNNLLSSTENHLLNKVSNDDSSNLKRNLVQNNQKQQNIGKKPKKTKKIKKTKQEIRVHKNILVILSGWICNYFKDLLISGKIIEKNYNTFCQLVGLSRFTTKKSTFISMKMFSKMFNCDVLRSFIGSFFQKRFLRVLARSRSVTKNQVLTFLPILYNGFLRKSMNKLV